MIESSAIWSDPRLVYTVAAAAVTLLVVTVWLFRRRRSGRQAAVVCLLASIGLHVALIALVPLIPRPPGNSADRPPDDEPVVGDGMIEFRSFDPDATETNSADSRDAPGPLPVSDWTDQPDDSSQTKADRQIADATEPSEPMPTPVPVPVEKTSSDSQRSPAFSSQNRVPASLASNTSRLDESMAELDSELEQMIEQAFDRRAPQRASDDLDENASADEESDEESVSPEDAVAAITNGADASSPTATGDSPSTERSETTTRPETPKETPAEAGSPRASGHSPSSLTMAAQDAVADVETLKNDFAHRVGDAKQRALQETGGDQKTEAAVAAALRFLAEAQRADGAWDPTASGAGQERAPLGETRGGAGANAESAITGLALLALMGAGNTHQRGEYAEQVYRGLAYLIRNQQPNGSLAGDASVYAATYSHGMAALAIGEAAAITGDASAIEAARRALKHTQSIQHPTTGGFRYTRGDPGDLSQLGWQAMVLDAAHRAGIRPDRDAVQGIQRFLRSVRAGAQGGLARYRPGEAPSRTMTAEALATRLLIGEAVPANEIAEAERSMLQQPPGLGQDNYYYWYYATLALHQLQDDAWGQWNRALQKRLLSTQKRAGNWSSATVWGGYGGTVYSTSMATLCLETYYRHALRDHPGRIAAGGNAPPNR